jgi:Gas vesicle synthesis protein GvpL/GvpF
MTASARSSAPAALGHYVYGIVEAGARPPLAAGVDDRHPARTLEAGEVAALVGDVPLAEFGEGRLEENLNRPGWLEEKVRAHEAVLETAQEAGAVLPFRFGTVYLSETHVHEMLERERETLLAALARVRGKREWGVKGFVDFERLAEWLHTAEPTSPEAPEEGAGATYLARKQIEHRAREGAERATLDVAEEAHARLAGLAAEASLNPRPKKASGRPARDLVLNGVYLVETSRESELREAVGELNERFGDRGVRFELTGPWPPYNFVAAEPSS